MSCKLRIRSTGSKNRISSFGIRIISHLHKLPSKLHRPTNSVLYAEVTTYGLTRNISYALTKLTESNISKLKSWFSSNYPVLNLAKTKTIDSSR